MEFVEQFRNFISQKLNYYTEGVSPSVMSNKMVSEIVVPVSAQNLLQAQKVVQSWFLLSEAYRQFLHKQTWSQDCSMPFDPGNHSVLMGYDFHLTESGLKLIEINTNATGWPLAYCLSKFHKISMPESFNESNLIQTFLTDFNQFSFSGLRPEFEVFLMDRSAAEQKTYFEFLMYQNLFIKNGYKFNIISSELSSTILEGSFVYNRDTDFTLSSPIFEKLKRLWTEKKICVSPHPFTHFLLAQKTSPQRILDWASSESNLTTDLKSSLLICQASHLKSSPISDWDPIELWRERKKFYFKPASSHGGKGVYRGRSISRTAFETLLTSDFLVQEAAEPSVLDDWKYDLRFFAYQGQIHGYVARLFQGQLLNFQTDGGGFAAIQPT